jgi:hypothetical protein
MIFEKPINDLSDQELSFVRMMQYEWQEEKLLQEKYLEQLRDITRYSDPLRMILEEREVHISQGKTQAYRMIADNLGFDLDGVK